jgi:hypothetical protein
MKGAEFRRLCLVIQKNLRGSMRLLLFFSAVLKKNSRKDAKAQRRMYDFGI